MKFIHYLIASLAVGCFPVPPDENSDTQSAGSVPLPRISIGFAYDGDSVRGDTSRQARFLTLGMNADLALGTPAEIAGNAGRLKGSVVVRGNFDGQSDSLRVISLPVFTNSASVCVGLGYCLSGGTRVDAMTISFASEHPIRDQFSNDDASYLRAATRLSSLGGTVDDAVIVANGEGLDSDDNPATGIGLVAIDNDGMLESGERAPARRSFFAPRSFDRLTIEGWRLVEESIAWTFGLEPLPAPTRDCGVVTEDDDAAAFALAARLRRHGCDVEALEPSSFDPEGLDLVVIAPSGATEAAGQVLRPRPIPVIAFWKDVAVIQGLGLAGEQANTLAMVESWDISGDAGELFSENFGKSVQVAPHVVEHSGLPEANLEDGAKIVATMPDGSVAAFAVAVGDQLNTGGSAAGRRIVVAGGMLEASGSPDGLAPTLEAVELIDHMLEWVLTSD